MGWNRIRWVGVGWEGMGGDWGRVGLDGIGRDDAFLG